MKSILADHKLAFLISSLLMVDIQLCWNTEVKLFVVYMLPGSGRLYCITFQ